jgi:hypothetical protein
MLNKSLSHFVSEKYELNKAFKESFLSFKFQLDDGENEKFFEAKGKLSFLQSNSTRRSNFIFLQKNESFLFPCKTLPF